MLSLEKNNIVAKYSSNCVAIPRIAGDSLRKISWLAAKVISLEVNWIMIRSVAPDADDFNIPAN